MKRFKFQLDKVLDYKQQLLDIMMLEHGAIIAQVNRQAEVLEAVTRRYYDYDEEYSLRKAEGLTIAEALEYQSGLSALDMDISREEMKLDALIKQEEAKRAEVVEARQGTSSIEKLREIKLKSYNKEAVKAEEAMIDEFVASRREVNADGA